MDMDNKEIMEITLIFDTGNYESLKDIIGKFLKETCMVEDYRITKR